MPATTQEDLRETKEDKNGKDNHKSHKTHTEARIETRAERIVEMYPPRGEMLTADLEGKKTPRVTMTLSKLTLLYGIH